MESNAQSSAWQAAKIWVQGHLGLERDTIHLLIGLTLLALAVAISLRRFRIAPFLWAFAIAVGVGCAMELLDLRDDLATIGPARWGASGLDILRTAVFPALGCVVAALILRWRGNGRR